MCAARKPDAPLRRAGLARGERGASAVEFAIVGPLLILLVFGIIEFGVVLHNLGAVREGVREGARQGVVASFGTNSSCSITGTVSSTETRKLICLTKSRTGMVAETPRVKLLLPSGYAVGNEMTVCAQAPMGSVSGLFSSMLAGKFVTARASMRIEKAATPAPVAAQEDPPPGGTWSWCS